MKHLKYFENEEDDNGFDSRFNPMNDAPNTKIEKDDKKKKKKKKESFLDMIDFEEPKGFFNGKFWQRKIK